MLTDKERKRDFVIALARVGLVSEIHIEMLYSEIKKDIEKMLKLEIIKLDSVKSGEKYYALNEDSFLYVKEMYPEFKATIYTSSNPEKDLILANKYFDLSSVERETWISKDDIQISTELTEVVDGAYVDKSNKIVAIAVLSSTSTKKTIDEIELSFRKIKADNMEYLLCK